MGILVRRAFLAAILISTASGLLKASRVDTGKLPNIVLIMADDLGYESLSCYGSTSYKTPRIDQLAAAGARFDHFYSQPLCTPTRVQIMTGQYNFRNYNGFGILSPGEKTFAHSLKQAGYATCVVGKWQLWGYNNARGKRGLGVYPEEAGFDEYCLWQIEERGERYADPLLYRNQRKPELFEGRYGPDVCVDYLCDFLARNREQPFLVYYPMILTHSPFVPTPLSPEWSGNRKQQDPRFFADMVAYMDRLVGRIADELDRLGLRDNTLILFLGDNGTHRSITSRIGDRVIQGAKGTPTDAGTRVPLVANWPGTIPGGQIRDDLVDTTDFLPTLLELTGAAALPGMKVDGRSFLPQLKGQTGDPRDWVFFHYDPEWGSWEKSRFARDRRWKLYDDGRLYDIPADTLEEQPIRPGEETSTAAQKARNRLRQVLDSFSN